MTHEQRTAQLNQVIEWAAKQENIRAVLVTSSTTNPNAPVDIFSDLDIELVVNNQEEFLADNSWLANFGDIITTIVEGTESFDGRCASRMVLYQDYSKIDFLIFSVEKFREIVEPEELDAEYDIGYKVMLDKDDLTAGMKPPTHTSFNIKRPTEEKFHWVLNNYWWDLTYVAKCLYRDELYFAKFMSEQVMRFEHQQVLLEWYIGAQHNWNVTTNKYGRLFKRYLSTDMWEKATSTLAAAGMEENWRALFAYISFGRELGQNLAAQLGYTYPTELDQRITAYVEHAYTLSKKR